MATTALDVVDGQGSADRRVSGNFWEYYERGVWKPCSEFTSFLEGECLAGRDSCVMNLDDTGLARYEWNFDDLTKKRQTEISRRGGKRRPAL